MKTLRKAKQLQKLHPSKICTYIVSISFWYMKWFFFVNLEFEGSKWRRWREEGTFTPNSHAGFAIVAVVVCQLVNIMTPCADE